MIIRKRTYDEVEADVAEMSIDHSKEIDLHQEYFIVNPDLEMYKKISDSGSLYIYTCEEEEEIVGYAFFMVTSNPHYKGVLYGVADLLYISPSYRKSGLFTSLMKFVEKDLKEEGVEVMCFNFKVAHDHQELAESLDFTRAEVMYSKYIGKDL